MSRLDKDMREKIIETMIEFWGGVDANMWDQRVAKDCTDQILSIVIEEIKEEVLADIGQGKDGTDYSMGWYTAMDFVEKKLSEVGAGRRDEKD